MIADMGPQRLSGGPVTTARDVYALGIVLFEMATGRLPFNDSHIIQSAMQRAWDAAPDVRALAPQLTPQWATAITRCLQRDPSGRPSTVVEVARQLEPRWRPPMAYWTRRQWALAAMT